MALIANDAAMVALKINATPFMESIISAPKLEKFQAHNFQQFDRKTDHEDHTYYYKYKLISKTDDDATLCKVFSIGLIGLALNWFHSLPSNSIKNFHDLCM